MLTAQMKQILRKCSTVVGLAKTNDGGVLSLQFGKPLSLSILIVHTSHQFPISSRTRSTRRQRLSVLTLAESCLLQDLLASVSVTRTSSMQPVPLAQSLQTRRLFNFLREACLLMPHLKLKMTVALMSSQGLFVLLSLELLVSVLMSERHATMVVC
jgi:hypothetical protein